MSTDTATTSVMPDTSPMRSSAPSLPTSGRAVKVTPSSSGASGSAGSSGKTASHVAFGAAATAPPVP